MCSGGLVQVADIYCQDIRTPSGAGNAYRVMAALGDHLRSLPRLAKRNQPGPGGAASGSRRGQPRGRQRGNQNTTLTQRTAAPTDTHAAADTVAIVAATGYEVLKMLQGPLKGDPKVVCCGRSKACWLRAIVSPLSASTARARARVCACVCVCVCACVRGARGRCPRGASTRPLARCRESGPWSL